MGVAVLLIENREQDMLCADVAACARRKGNSRLQKPLCARSKGVWRELCRIARAGASDSAFEVSRVETACLERFGCNACAFLCKTEKNVLGANVVLTHAFGGLNREVYRLVCFLSEAFDVEHIHTPPCLVINLLYNPKLCEFISQERRPFDVAVMRRKGFAQIYAERRGLYGCHKLVDLRRRHVLYLSR